jgi:D-glycero-alpha-D-manno-heptose-7-phosphate kinase
MIITKTPFRVSFFGGGTDFKEYFNHNKGCVLSTTIDKFTYINYRKLPPFFNFSTKLVYSKIEHINETGQITHPLIKSIFEDTNTKNAHLVYDADLPSNSGLGSSSAFAVGLYNAINYVGKEIPKNMLADRAIYIEREKLKEHGGFQDQIAVAYGGFNKIEFSKEGYNVTPINISPDRKKFLESHLLLFFTGFSRLSTEIEKDKISNMELNLKTLSELRDLAYKGIDILESNSDLDKFGELLDYSWELKKKLSSKVSNKEIDKIYAKAIESGAIGGKLLGAGYGGFLLIFADPKNHFRIRKVLSHLIYVPFRFEEKGTQVIYYQKD